jgi:hypothetical protein
MQRAEAQREGCEGFGEGFIALASRSTRERLTRCHSLQWLMNPKHSLYVCWLKARLQQKRLRFLECPECGITWFVSPNQNQDGPAVVTAACFCPLCDEG